MAYIINKTNGEILLTLQDGTVDATTSLELVGRNYTGYGEAQNENFVFLLENFANQSPPARPITGQTWFDTDNLKLNVYTGTAWIPVGAATISVEQPEPVLGSFWLRPETDQLYVYSDHGWRLIGPEVAEGFDITKAQTQIVKDTSGTSRAVIVLLVNGTPLAVCSETNFTLNSSTPIVGFSNLTSGITLSTSSNINGNITGNATTASRFETARTINGVVFDGQSNITIESKTAQSLIRGNYLTGNNFDGTTQVTWAVDGSSEDIVNKVVIRDNQGKFATNEITANKFVGPLNGNVTVSQGTSTFDKIVCNTLEGPRFTGNATSATKLSPGCNINGVFFDGNSNITIPANAGSLTGNRLASNVTESFLNVVSTLNSLDVRTPGISVGETGRIKLHTTDNLPTLEDLDGQGLFFVIKDLGQTNNKSTLRVVPSSVAVNLGGSNVPTILPDSNEVFNIGAPTYKFGSVYAKVFNGEATSARYADLAENYLADDEYEAGTVLDFGGEKEVTIGKSSSSKVAGIVSTRPAYLMNSDCQGTYVVPIALQGRVPCKVIGKIEKGDLLIGAGNGFAMASADPKIGTVIGKALENFSGSEGIIEVAVSRF